MYEAPEVIEVGNAKDVILGEKTVFLPDTVQEEPLDQRSISFAEYDE